MLLLVNGDLRMYVGRNHVWYRTAIDGLEPLIAIVFLPESVVFTLERRRSVNPLDTARVVPAAAQKIRMLSTTLE